MKQGIGASLLLCAAILWTGGNCYSGGSSEVRRLELVHQWKLLDYTFPSNSQRREAVANGNLVPSNGIPIDVAPSYDSNGRLRVFTTIPRFLTGVPYTLATVAQEGGDRLVPYPSYDWHNSHGSNCDGITSAFRVAINECNQMWVIDSGRIGNNQYCPPQLLLFDLQTDQLIHRYRFNTSVYTPVASLLITPIVEVSDPPPRGRCQRTMIYIADVTFHGLVVYDHQQQAAWRVENKFMHPDPDYGTHTIAGESFNLMDGMFGLSIDKRNLYFHPLASASEYAVPLNLLKNRATWVENMEALPNEFRKLGSRSSQCAAEAMDSNDNLYCVTFQPVKLIVWNVNTPYQQRNFRELEANPQEIEFVSGMKVVKNNNGVEELWMLSNRYQKIGAGTQNGNEVNFRILKRKLENIQKGTPPRVTPAKDLHNKLIFSS